MKGEHCFHCGEVIEDNIDYQEHSFCCEGCRTVYQILSENNLGDFYTIDEDAGRKQKSIAADKFDYLDLEEIKQKLISFSDNQINKIILFLPAIHCSSCIWLLENLQKINPSVRSSQVDFVKKEATITYDSSQLKLSELALLLSKIGYEPNINLETKAEKKSHINKPLLYKLGVAGFCFGNIMLLSFPEYLGLKSNQSEFQKLFSYMNLILALPVLIYSSRDYFISAYKGIRSKFFNIDIPISLGIVTLFLRSSWEVLSQTGAGYFDSLTGLVFFLLVGKWFQDKTYRGIQFERSYKSYFPIAVKKKTATRDEIIPLEKLKVGDQLIIRNEEIIPADAKLIEGEARIDYSFVTGESKANSVEIDEKIFAGGRQKGQNIVVEIEKEVNNSYLTSLWNQDIFQKEGRAGYKNFVDKISRHFTLAIIHIALGSLAYWLTVDLGFAFNVFTAVLIVACPCALALTLPFTYGNGIRILGKKGLFLKSPEVIERMHTITDIVFDKTGTITDISKSSVEYELANDEIVFISSILSHSSHPIAETICANFKSDYIPITNFVEHKGQGVEGEIQSDHYRIGSAKWILGTENLQKTGVWIEKNGKFIGQISIKNAYRSDFLHLLQFNSNYNFHVISGDNEGEKQYLESLKIPSSHLHFNASPEDKLNYIKKLQQENKKTLMIGDGLNDAGALKQSDVGFAINENVYNFSPSCDGIILASNFAHITDFLRYSKDSMNVVKISILISFLYNVVGLSFAVTGNLTPLVAAILMPLSSISVVVVVTLLTNLLGRKIKRRT
ncbi:MAG: heavy metal translocating P-type ATPase metal-binding domain-containing protein [Crocinitomicaceae bacterium]|nr:heavy metal translocating P-type ATPase metal-binding domain-containing protein [Crocinitomicaceae bacterium]